MESNECETRPTHAVALGLSLKPQVNVPGMKTPGTNNNTAITS